MEIGNAVEGYLVSFVILDLLLFEMESMLLIYFRVVRFNFDRLVKMNASSFHKHIYPTSSYSS